MTPHRPTAKFVQLVHVQETEHREEAVLCLDEDGNIWFLDRTAQTWGALPSERDLSEQTE